MANFNLPDITEGMSNEDLLVVVGKMKKTLDWLLYNLDVDNMPQIGNLLGDLEGNYSLISQTIDGIQLSVGNIAGDVSALELTAQSISSTVSNHAGEISTIKQTATGIQSQVTNQAGQISSINQTVVGIQSTVSSLDSEVGGFYSEITQLSNSISSKVSWIDYNGEEIVSLIEQTPSRIRLSADKIDLEGITTIYSDDTDSYATFDRYGDFYIQQGNNTVFEIYNQISAIDMLSFGENFLTTNGDDTYAYGEWDFEDCYDVIGVWRSTNLSRSGFINYTTNGIVVRDEYGDTLGSIYFD